MIAQSLKVPEVLEVRSHLLVTVDAAARVDLGGGLGLADRR
ncbi:hypothetical protein [Microtetraspora niveoalba]|nr:hypothetical protein [Microtetraspora niveoalba]